MRKLLTIAALVLVATLAASTASAQIVATDAYQLTYLSDVESFAIINTGQIGSPIDAGTRHGTVCADIYLFDSNQEMLACCSCPITANGMVRNLEAISLTGAPFTPGVAKIVADAGCDETNITQPVNGGLRAFMTNRNFSSPPAPPAANLTENLWQSAPLTITEQQFLGQTCAFVHYLGSGRGICACRREALPM